MEQFVIDSKKASPMWGGICIGYVVSKEEIETVSDNVCGDTVIIVYPSEGRFVEIAEVHTLDMCVNGKMSCRSSAHCVGEGCDFCGKFTAMYNGW